MGVNKLLIPLASLLSGLALLVVGTGLMFAAIGAQAGSANFSGLVTGLVMSAYFAGFVYGTYACPLMIRRVGHIRAFAAMASIASALPMFHALWTNAWAWGVLRFITGVCLVGLYIVVESWLNVVATTAQRGKVFAAYMAVSGISMAAGQWLILVGDRFGFVPFALASILFSFALIPITLTPVPEPEAMEVPRFVLKELFYISPIGVIGTLGSGLLGGAFYSLGHVFGQGVGFSERGIATFMAATILGGAAFQWPIGHLSDKHDRRWVLFWVCALCACVAGLGFYLAREFEASLIVLGIVYGGLSFTVYGLSVAHVNDLIDSKRVLEVTSGLLLLYGIGSTIGPTLAGGVMDVFGPEALMLYFAIVLGLLAVSVWAFAPAKYIHAEQSSHKTDYVVMGSGSQAVLQMDPRRPDFQHSRPAPPFPDPGH
ncbi:MFS transporter [Rhodoferax lacus]|uniref:MFS transporter n=1 Tax=Rhodoferax lacus TaxID=2184758 RepID=A0A3E1R7H7_9BURK|nr:MFS transporter [Rhodoferax lacus]RFO95203.1 MFS transporter [Rhodoferax lacus]